MRTSRYNYELLVSVLGIVMKDDFKVALRRNSYGKLICGVTPNIPSRIETSVAHNNRNDSLLAPRESSRELHLQLPPFQ